MSRVLHILKVVKNKREYSAAVFLKMKKAFDRVWDAALVYKLTKTTTAYR